MTQAHICKDGYNAEAEAVHCDDCDWSGTLDQVDMITDIEERISPGEIVPAGQCPECGALAHLDEFPEWSVPARLARAEAALNALLDWHDELGGWEAPCWAQAFAAVGRKSQFIESGEGGKNILPSAAEPEEPKRACEYCKETAPPVATTWQQWQCACCGSWNDRPASETQP